MIKNIEFREKSVKSKRKIDIITKKIFDFILGNKKYLRMIFFIIRMKKEVTSDVVLIQYIENNSEYEEVETDNNLSEFKNLLIEFYKKDIDYRRGDLLELLIFEVAPLKGNVYTECEKIKEAKVYIDGRKLDEKDIDLVCKKNVENKGKEIECIECKVSLDNFLKEPLSEVAIKKIEFMLKVKEILNNNGTLSILYFATLTESIDQVYEILENNGYQEIYIFNASEIVNYLN